MGPNKISIQYLPHTGKQLRSHLYFIKFMRCIQYGVHVSINALDHCGEDEFVEVYQISEANRRYNETANAASEEYRICRSRPISI